MTENKKIGLLGGTFDPIHYGHLLAAEYTLSELGLDKVVFIPAARPPHKDSLRISDEKTRYRLVELAIRDNSGFSLSDLELKRPGPSYTIDTLNFFQIRYPETTVYFIMGADSLLLIDTWKDAERLAEKGRFAVVTRPGYQVDWRRPPLLSLPQSLKEHLNFLEMPALDISSSDIRKRVRAGKSIKYLLPPQVEDYIYAYQLYKE